MATSAQFRLKLTNKPNMPDHVDLQSLGSTAKAWSELLSRATMLIFERELTTEGNSSSSEQECPDVHFVVKRVEVASLEIHSEPASLATENTVDLGEVFWADVYGFLADGFHRLESGSMPEDVFPQELIQPARDLITTFSQNGIGRMQFGLNDTLTSELTWERAGMLQKSAIRERSIGSVDGVITSISLSNKPQFGLRPWHGNIVTCHFNRDRMLSDVTSAFLKRASVFGVIVRDERGRPLKITSVRTIDPFPEDADTPSVLQSAGTIPDLTEGLSTAEWLRRHRGEE